MELMQRAYAMLDIKAADEPSGIITGIASTPTLDSVGDIMEPKGAQFKLPMPLLWQHNSKMPIGHVIKVEVTDTGINITARIMRGLDIGFIDEAWKLIKAGLVRGLSIGFKGVEASPIKGTGGIHFVKWNWLELSAVTLPAQSEATIIGIKSADARALLTSSQEMLSASDRAKVDAAVQRVIKGLPIVKL